jgi:hypothetical protein
MRTDECNFRACPAFYPPHPFPGAGGYDGGMDLILLIVLSIILAPVGVLIANYIRSGYGPPDD